MFSDLSGRFYIGREVTASSQSSEVRTLLSTAQRFSSIGELVGVSFANTVFNPSVAEIKEYVVIEEIDFDYGNGRILSAYQASDHLVIAGAMFGSLIDIFGGWRSFYREVVGAGGSMSLEWDSDGVDYERLIDYTVRLKMVGGLAERLIISEGLRLWGK
jgi:hypothetical protein